MTINELFKLGMKRSIEELIPPGKIGLNLGSGLSPTLGFVNLDYPTWNADIESIPEEDESVDTIYAFHFLEHLTGANVIRILSEAQRVLKVGGDDEHCRPSSPFADGLS